MNSLSSEAILLERIGAEFVIYQNMVAGTENTDDFDLLNWFQIQQIQFPVLARFSCIIHSITPSQNENENNFHLQASILHHVVLISLLKCSIICFSSTETALPWAVIPLLIYLGDHYMLWPIWLMR